MSKRPGTKAVPKNIHDTRKWLRQAAAQIKKANDRDLQAMLGTGALDEFLAAICPPRQQTKAGSIYQYLLENKMRAALIAAMHTAMVQNYTMFGSLDTGHKIRVSPTQGQWFEDGVVFLHGDEPFSGAIGLYRNGEFSFAVAARDAEAGDQLGKDDFDFIPIEEAKRRQTQAPKSEDDLQRAIEDLEDLIRRRVTEERQYQTFFETNPWVFGGEWTAIQGHQRFDDKSIPDFSAVRVRDQARDIIEIKHPFIDMFNKDGSFAAEFNGAWHQVTNYRMQAIEDADSLLRRKGLRFSNPKGVLVAGFELNRDQKRSVRRLEQSTPGLHVYSYDEVLKFARHTKDFLARPASVLTRDAAEPSDPIEG